MGYGFRVGSSVQDLGPLDGSGGVCSGLAILCPKCNGRFMLDRCKLGNLLGQEGCCPYCSERSRYPTDPPRAHDTRPYHEP